MNFEKAKIAKAMFMGFLGAFRSIEKGFGAKFQSLEKVWFVIFSLQQHF